jgi:hypothetical protein
MTRARWLIAALLCVPLPVGAQEPEWMAIACTVESPAETRGTFMTIYFLERGQVRFNGKQYPATVNNAEIRFCLTAMGKQLPTCYKVSRTSGMLLGIPQPLVDCCTDIHLVTGRCALSQHGNE